jgi:hypothetical protein
VDRSKAFGLRLADSADASSLKTFDSNDQSRDGLSSEEFELSLMRRLGCFGMRGHYLCGRWLSYEGERGGIVR